MLIKVKNSMSVILLCGGLISLPAAGEAEPKPESPATTTNGVIVAPNEKADLRTTTEIRKEIQKSDLSPQAKKIIVATANGKVTLRGQVRNEDEARMLENIAVRIAGSDNVTNETFVYAE